MSGIEGFIGLTGLGGGDGGSLEGWGMVGAEEWWVRGPAECMERLNK